MTISSTTRKVGPFIGNGSASFFAFPFKVFKAEDIRVVMLDVATGIEYVVGTPDGYTVSLNIDQDANPGGSIQMVEPLWVGFNIVITSDQPELQETDITNQGGFYPEVLTSALDELTIDVQQLREQADRSLRFPITDPPLEATLPPADQRAGNIIYFGDDGGIVTAPPEAVKVFAGSLSGTQDSVNKVFTLTNNGTPLGQATKGATVWNNYPLIPGAGYTFGPAVDQVTFAVAPDPADVLFAQGFIYFVAPVPPPPATDRFFAGTLLGPRDLTNKIFTLTNNGTPLTVAPEQVFVWQNFPLAPGVGYTMGPNPNQVTYTNPPKPTDVLYAQGTATL